MSFLGIIGESDSIAITCTKIGGATFGVRLAKGVDGVIT